MNLIRRLVALGKGLALVARYKAGQRDFRQAALRGARLVGADLHESNLFRADLSGADMSNTNLRGADLTEATLSGANLSRADLRGANLSRTRLSGVSLREASLDGANMRGTYLMEINLSGFDLSGTDLSEAELFHADLSAANLEGANLSGANLHLANLNGANLGKAKLKGANLSGANLSGIDLSGFDLSGAVLSDAYLRGVNLSGANLSGANLYRANLDEANLDGANLSGANLEGTNPRDAASLALAEARQQTVDALVALQDFETESMFAAAQKKRRSYWINDVELLVREGQCFDVNQYFSILNHLSIEPGYTLDYALNNDGIGAQPCIYARRLDEPRLLHVKAVEQRAKDEGWDDRMNLWYRAYTGTHGYTMHIRTDNSPDAFFQLALLDLMGGRFYLYWHACYYDFVVVCNQEALERYFRTPGGREDSVREEAKRFDLAPVVDMGPLPYAGLEDKVYVEVTEFGHWEGVVRRGYLIDRRFPHRFRVSPHKDLVPYCCFWLF
jgi:uncharacterized protein YjbI with pentapeptide repeats